MKSDGKKHEINYMADFDSFLDWIAGMKDALNRNFESSNKVEHKLIKNKNMKAEIKGNENHKKDLVKKGRKSYPDLEHKVN